MDAYANALLVAIPGFMLMIVVEAIYGHMTGKQTMNSLDTISSLSSGITNVVKDSLGLIIILVSYPFLVKYLAIVEFEATWLVYLIGFICIDFAGYWTHRLAHSINFFWNKHLIHHSSEEFNLPCALRQTVSNIVGIYGLFLIPAAFLGIPAKVIGVIAPIHLFMQFWYHTRHIPKLGWLEYLIITPSQHRVHHAINPEYLDKNLGQIFPWWDRLFGTFQEEMEEVPPVYGITRPVRTWNPILINYQHIWLLIKDAWRTKNWKDKFRIWFMPTGWRPADVEEKYPVYKIDDVYHFEKYKAGAKRPLIAWSWFHLVTITVLLLYMFWQFTAIGFPSLFVYGGLIFTSIFGYTSLMDQTKYSLWVEIARSFAGVSWIGYTGDWFGLEAILPYGSWLILLYFLSSAIGAYQFHRQWSQQKWTMGASQSSFS